MSRKHKSNRRRKITQSNVPAPFKEEQTQQAETHSDSPMLPESTTEKIQQTSTSTLPDDAAENALSGSMKQNNDNESPYSLDEHYANQEKNDSEYKVLSSEPILESNLKTESQNTDSDSVGAAVAATTTTNETPTTASLAEYEQLKRKNRRRLVGAGALVLVAGSLFAAASKDHARTHNDPALTVVKVASAPVVQPDILRPAGSENKIDLSMDGVPNQPLKLKNNTVLTPQDRAALIAKQKAAANANQTSAVLPVNQKSHASTQTAAERAKTNEEAKLAAERRQRAQSKAAEAEAKRLAAEREVAHKARIAQANADRNRNTERAQLTAERAAQEKQRAQRQAAERANKTQSSSGSKAIQAGAFADKESAKRMQQQLKNLNYNARLEEVHTHKGKVYRVRTGDFASDSEAKNALNRMQSQGVNGMVVGK